MASYAPLFAHVEGWQWTPDLIWHDNIRSYGTPDYYVQKLFSTNKGSVVVPALMNGQALSGQDSLYVSACIDAATHELILKLVNTGSAPLSPHIRVEGSSSLAAKGAMTILKSGRGLDRVNSLDDPFAVSPVEEEMVAKGNLLSPTLSPYSFNILRIKTK
jgi:alpha-L-arabinofuranosidase